MSTLPPLPDIFGNYSLRGLAELIGPEPVSWLPTAPGWRYLALLLLVWLVWRGHKAWRYWLRNRYRRTSLQQLEQLVATHGYRAALLNPLAALLKATALQCYPRHDIAALSGNNWLLWLNQHSNGAPFAASSQALLATAVYQAPTPLPGHDVEQLAREASAWIAQHRGPPHD